MKTRLSFVLVVVCLLVRCGSDPTAPANPSSGVLVLTSANFGAQVLQNSRPCLVEFYSPTCSVCASMEPVVESLAARYEGRAVVGQVDVTVETSLAGDFGILYVPTFVFVAGGAEQERIVGAVSEAELAAVIESLLVAGS